MSRSEIIILVGTTAGTAISAAILAIIYLSCINFLDPVLPPPPPPNDTSVKVDIPTTGFYKEPVNIRFNIVDTEYIFEIHVARNGKIQSTFDVIINSSQTSIFVSTLEVFTKSILVTLTLSSVQCNDKGIYTVYVIEEEKTRIISKELIVLRRPHVPKLIVPRWIARERFKNPECQVSSLGIPSLQIAWKVRNADGNEDILKDDRYTMQTRVEEPICVSEGNSTLDAKLYREWMNKTLCCFLRDPENFEVYFESCRRIFEKPTNETETFDCAIGGSDIYSPSHTTYPDECDTFFRCIGIEYKPDVCGDGLHYGFSDDQDIVCKLPSDDTYCLEYKLAQNISMMPTDSFIAYMGERQNFTCWIENIFKLRFVEFFRQGEHLGTINVIDQTKNFATEMRFIPRGQKLGANPFLKFAASLIFNPFECGDNDSYTCIANQTGLSIQQTVMINAERLPKTLKVKAVPIDELVCEGEMGYPSRRIISWKLYKTDESVKEFAISVSRIVVSHEECSTYINETFTPAKFGITIKEISNLCCIVRRLSDDNATQEFVVQACWYSLE